MAKKQKAIRTRNVDQLSRALNLDQGDGVEMEFRAQLNIKIVEAVKRKGLTHAEVAQLSRASRTRITAILNGNTQGISTDLLLRILYALGYRIKATFSPVKLAA